MTASRQYVARAFLQSFYLRDYCSMNMSRYFLRIFLSNKFSSRTDDRLSRSWHYSARLESMTPKLGIPAISSKLFSLEYELISPHLFRGKEIRCNIKHPLLHLKTNQATKCMTVRLAASCSCGLPGICVPPTIFL